VLLSKAACCASTQAKATGGKDMVPAVALSPDGRLVAAGEQGAGGARVGGPNGR
jgi:hypothetical protein